MILRLSKILFICTVALFSSLVAFGNITDYSTNFQFVHHVFMMDTIFPDAKITYRAITSTWVHHVAYIFIITLETLTAVLCWVGAYRLFKGIKLPAAEFHVRKNVALAGLSVGFLVWNVSFMSFGGEWFGMWMSKQWNGVPDAYRFFSTIILVIVYLMTPDGELASASRKS